MQAGEPRSLVPYYGYNSSTSNGYGSISPNYIYHQGTKYEIDSFYSSSFYKASHLYFKDNNMPNGEKMIIEVNGTAYTLEKQTDYMRYRIATTLFTATGTYAIKILSIE